MVICVIYLSPSLVTPVTANQQNFSKTELILEDLELIPFCQTGWW